MSSSARMTIALPLFSKTCSVTLTPLFPQAPYTNWQHCPSLCPLLPHWIKSKNIYLLYRKGQLGCRDALFFHLTPSQRCQATPEHRWCVVTFFWFWFCGWCTGPVRGGGVRHLRAEKDERGPWLGLVLLPGLSATRATASVTSKHTHTNHFQLACPSSFNITQPSLEYQFVEFTYYLLHNIINLIGYTLQVCF